MFKKITGIIAIATLCLTTSGGVGATEHEKAANPQQVAKAEKNYQNIGIRIESGIKQKQLTTTEATQAKSSYESISKLWEKIKADRKVTITELQDINAKQAALNKLIYNNRNDSEGASAREMVRQANQSDTLKNQHK